MEELIRTKNVYQLGTTVCLLLHPLRVYRECRCFHSTTALTCDDRNENGRRTTEKGILKSFEVIMNKLVIWIKSFVRTFRQCIVLYANQARITTANTWLDRKSRFDISTLSFRPPHNTVETHFDLPRHSIPLGDELEQCLRKELSNVGSSYEHEGDTNESECDREHLAKVCIDRNLSITCNHFPFTLYSMALTRIVIENGASNLICQGRESPVFTDWCSSLLFLKSSTLFQKYTHLESNMHNERVDRHSQTRVDEFVCTKGHQSLSHKKGSTQSMTNPYEKGHTIVFTSRFCINILDLERMSNGLTVCVLLSRSQNSLSLFFSANLMCFFVCTFPQKRLHLDSGQWLMIVSFGYLERSRNASITFSERNKSTTS